MFVIVVLTYYISKSPDIGVWRWAEWSGRVAEWPSGRQVAQALISSEELVEGPGMCLDCYGCGFLDLGHSWLV